MFTVRQCLDKHLKLCELGKAQILRAKAVVGIWEAEGWLKVLGLLLPSPAQEELQATSD